MTNLIKNIEINPLRTSSSLGAAVFFLGLNNAVVLMHGAVGCASFDKVTLTKHFRENIPIVTTALNESGAILGGNEFMTAGVKNVYEKMKPDFIGIASSGLTETNGEDIESIIKDFKAEQEDSFANLIYASTPDYKGGFEEGYITAMLSLLNEAVKTAQGKPLKRSNKNTKTINIFCPPSFTPQDFLELREALDYFGLKQVMIPDLGLSLDGHLDERGYLQTTSGGLNVQDLREIKSAELNLIIGSSLKTAIKDIEELTGLKTHYFHNICGLKNSDKLFNFLSEITGKEIPEKYKRDRRRLMDAYLDSHFYLTGKDIAIALEIDLLDSFSAIYSEIGVNLQTGISTKFDDDVARRFSNFYDGDLDLLCKSGNGNIGLIVSNSNAKFYAESLGIPLLKAGFPIIDEIGHNYKQYILYEGALNLAVQTANLLNKE